ncbi:FUSC family protein [Corynebacterium sp. 335C]
MAPHAAPDFAHPAPPPPPSVRRLFFDARSPVRRWPVALRAAIALFVPAVLTLNLGHEDGMLLVAGGFCVVLYGDGNAYRARAAVLGWAAALLTGLAFLGSLTGHVVYGLMDAHGGAQWPLLISAVLSALVGMVVVYGSTALRLPPPGPFFFVMTFGAVTLTGRTGTTPLEVGGRILLGAAWAWLVGMSGVLVDRFGPERAAVAAAEEAVAAYEADPNDGVLRNRAAGAMQTAWHALHDARAVRGGRILPGPRRELAETALRLRGRMYAAVAAGVDPDDIADAAQADIARPHTNRPPLARPTWWYRILRSAGFRSHAGLTATRVGVSALAAGVLSVAVGLDRPDWAVISAVLVLQRGPDRISGSVRAVHRFLGSLTGVALFALIHVLVDAPLALLVVLACLSFTAELTIVRNYAIAVSATTPLALLMGGALDAPLGDIVAARILEIIVGVLCALAALWLVLRRGSAEALKLTESRVHRAVDELADARLAGAGEDEILQRRRDLQFELHGNQLAAEQAARDMPEWTRANWPTHASTQLAGYATLARP